MLSIPSSVIRFAELARTRMMMFLLFYLSLEFARMFISASAATHPYMAMWSTVLFESTVIIVFSLLYGDMPVGRDINALNFYGVVIHLAYLPFYYLGIDASMYHNYGALAINWLVVLRLLYIGNHDLLKRVSAIESAKQWLWDSRWFGNAYINGLTIAVFLMCAAPLCTLIFLINTDQMRVTGIAVIMFAFFVAFDNAKKRASLGAKSVDNAQAAVPKEVQGDLARATETIFELNVWLKVMGGLFLFVVLGMASSINFYKASFFDAGYSTGFSDAKSGAEPKRETNFQKALECIEVNRSHFPAPSDAGCPPPAKPWG